MKNTLGRLLLALLTCSVLSTKAQKIKEIDWQGHRGCRGIYPENTIRAMIEAIKMGVTTLELDVVVTRDKQVVLSHEPFMAHEISTSPEGTHITQANERQFNIYQMDYKELKKWDVGLKPHPRFPKQVKIAAYKPLLSEVIDSVENYIKTHKIRAVKYNIETKIDPSGDGTFHPNPQEFVETVLKVITEKQILDRVIIQSFDKRTLQWLHQQNVPVKLSYLLEKSEITILKDQLKALGFKPDIISPEFSNIDAAYVRYCHRKKIMVVPWTVNEENEIKRLIDLEVDGIISDYPNLFQYTIENTTKKKKPSQDLLRGFHIL